MARATMRAAACNNPNRPGTHFLRNAAPHRRSFLIHCPELETDLTCTKQTPGPISNRQFFALLKLPDAWADGPSCKPMIFRVPHARFVSVGLSSNRRDARGRQKGTRTPPRPLRKRHSLIGNEMHSPVNTTALQCATSIFLIGNEFRLRGAAFQPISALARAANRDAVSVIEYPSRNAKNPNWRPI